MTDLSAARAEGPYTGTIKTDGFSVKPSVFLANFIDAVLNKPLLRLHHKRKDQQQNKKNRAEEYDLQYILRLLLHTVRTPHKSDLPADNRYHKRQTGAVRTQA